MGIRKEGARKKRKKQAEGKENTKIWKEVERQGRCWSIQRKDKKQEKSTRGKREKMQQETQNARRTKKK